MTIAGATYQTILDCLKLQSCQLYNVAHDFWYDPRMYDLNAIVCMDKVRRLVHGNAKADINLQKLIQVTKDSMSLLTKAD